MSAFDPLRTWALAILTCASVGLIRVRYQRIMLYFFDTRDNETFIQDEIGVECANLEAVKKEAAVSLAELARDVLPGSIRRVLSVEVRNAFQPILTDVLTFEAMVWLTKDGMAAPT